MARTDDDSWDLASSVGATATLVATGRAIASQDSHGLIDDPFAAPLVRAVGIDVFTKMVDGELSLDTLAQLAPDAAERARSNIDEMAVRTRFFDDFFITSGEAGIRQAVILASGLDTRAYRLAWPAGSVVFEVDQPTVLEFKTRTLTDLEAEPAAELHTVPVDLRDDWPAALRANGFDPQLPTAWIAEGLLIYLPPEAQDRLFDNITALSAPRSRLATEYHLPGMAVDLRERGQVLSEQWRQHGLDLDLANLWYDGERNSVVDYLTDRGWSVTARRRPELFAEYGREFPTAEAAAPQRNSQAVIAIRD